jgi:hypothetical protein
MLLWLVTTVALAVAVPVAWAQKTVVNEDGYVALAQKSATDPQLQQAMASELTTQVVTLASKRDIAVNQQLVHGVATGYTLGPVFPAQFAQANRFAHAWLFTNSANQSKDAQGHWQVDIAPMLAGASFQQMLSAWNIEVPSTLYVPVAVNDNLRPGRLHYVATFGPWVAIGVAAVTGMLALLTLLAARSRGKALASLGVSALLVGAAGWAGLEIGRRYLDDALSRTTGNIRTIADVMVAHAETSLHQWLNLTLAAGGVLVVFGVIVSMIGGLRKS